MLYASTRKKVREGYEENKRSGIEEPSVLDCTAELNRTLKRLIEDSMSEELRRYMVVGPYVRSESRRDQLNGGYVRHLLTRVGDVKIKVPRTRSGGYKSKVLKAYQRRQEDVDKEIIKCFINGLSTRKVGKCLAIWLGERVSPSTVSRIAKVLDEEVARYHKRKLGERYKYLLLDGIVLKERCAVETKRKSALVAYGITDKGMREIIDFRISCSESETQWEYFLNDLYRRGLDGAGLELIVTDGGKGLESALETVHGNVPHQRCWAHKSRNVLDKVKKADHKEVKSYLRKISHAENRQSAVSAYWDFTERWGRQYPRAVASLRAGFDKMSPYMKMPEKHWNQVRTTNAIERAFREVRRRIRPMGVCGNNESLERILFAVFNELNENYKDIPLKTFTHK